MQTRSRYSALAATLGNELCLAPQLWNHCLGWASGEAAFTPQQSLASTSGTSIIRVRGALAQHYSESGWTVSTDLIGKLFDQAMQSNAAAVIFDVDSPGGSIAGTQTLADKIYRARGQGTRLIALANSTMASAAYWIFSACDEVFASPHADTGAVGCWSAHEDISEMLKKMGVKITTISSGKYKTEGSPWSSLSPEARAEMQRRCDGFCRDFHHAVARHRGVAASHVAEHFGQGRVLQPAAAIRARAIDGVATLEQLALRYGPMPTAKNRGARAAYLAEQVRAEREERVAYLLRTERNDRLRALESFKQHRNN